ncbi:hypothetical protein BSKO_12608 [Bryopsis sp. KO-2023]|nr:hypothetical protein BSKO_12608 [Bryopsis sp. KO-2023]
MGEKTSKIAVDLVAGTAGGATQLCVGHPFDTVKVKLQSQSAGRQFSGPFDAVKNTLSKEGFRGLYKGMGAPLATVAAFNAVLFSSRGTMERLLSHSDGSPLTLWDQAVAGMGAGVAVSFVATPTELLKCRLQAQGEISTAVARLKAAGIDPTTVKLYKGPMHVARDVVATEGGLLALFRGFNITLIREIPGNAFMFAAYEAAKLFFAQQQGLRDVSELGTGALLFAGGVGGMAFWLPMYPTDVVKSKLQIDSFKNPTYRGIWDCTKKIYHAEGTRGFYHGYAPSLLRSFPANAACFFAYELCLNLLR